MTIIATVVHGIEFFAVTTGTFVWTRDRLAATPFPNFATAQATIERRAQNAPGSWVEDAYVILQ